MKSRKQGGKSWLVRVENPVTIDQAAFRLNAYKDTHGSGPHRASTLAAVIWPDTRFLRQQGAGAAASRVLKRLGKTWGGDRNNWGWYL